MSIFRELEVTVLKYIKDKMKFDSLTKDQIAQVVASHMSNLDKFIDTWDAFDEQSMHSLFRKYKELPNISQKNIRPIFLSLQQNLTGKAATYESKKPFGAAEEAADRFKKILKEVNSNLDKLLPEGSFNIYNCKLSGVMLLGILREIDLFLKYNACLWDHFTKACAEKDLSVHGYRHSFVVEKFDDYVEVVNNVISKDKNYSFLKDVHALKQQNSDLVLYANDQSFLSFLNPSKITGSIHHYLKQGLFGFGIITWILMEWDDWKHARYQRDKDFKEWLEQSVTLLRMSLSDHDPNSPEYRKLVKIINTYDQKIVQYDRKISEYEKK